MSEIHTVIVFGATGKTGKQLLQRAILEGLEVTAFVRNPKKIPENISSKVHRVIQGDALDKGRVEDAIEGHDAVLSAIGTGQNFGTTTLISESCSNIIAAMEKHGVRKLAVVSMAQVLPQEKPRFPKKIIEDHKLQITLLREASDKIDWIAMMAPNITDSPHIEADYKVEIEKIPGKHSVTTGELADFMVKVFMDRPSTEQFRHCMIGISSKPKLTIRREFKIAALSVLIAAGAVAVVYYRLLPVILQEYLDEVLK